MRAVIQCEWDRLRRRHLEIDVPLPLPLALVQTWHERSGLSTFGGNGPARTGSYCCYHMGHLFPNSSHGDP